MASPTDLGESDQRNKAVDKNETDSLIKVSISSLYEKKMKNEWRGWEHHSFLCNGNGNEVNENRSHCGAELDTGNAKR